VLVVLGQESSGQCGGAGPMRSRVKVAACSPHPARPRHPVTSPTTNARLPTYHGSRRTPFAEPRTSGGSFAFGASNLQPLGANGHRCRVVRWPSVAQRASLATSVITCHLRVVTPQPVDAWHSVILKVSNRRTLAPTTAAAPLLYVPRLPRQAVGRPSLLTRKSGKSPNTKQNISPPHPRQETSMAGTHIKASIPLLLLPIHCTPTMGDTITLSPYVFWHAFFGKPPAHNVFKNLYMPLCTPPPPSPMGLWTMDYMNLPLSEYGL
jgi:hypothetical protein